MESRSVPLERLKVRGGVSSIDLLVKENLPAFIKNVKCVIGQNIR